MTACFNVIEVYITNAAYPSNRNSSNKWTSGYTKQVHCNKKTKTSKNKIKTKQNKIKQTQNNVLKNHKNTLKLPSKKGGGGAMSSSLELFRFPPPLIAS